MKIDKSQFNTKSELLSYVKAHKKDLIEMKKHQIKRTDAISFDLFDKTAQKQLTTNYEDNPESGVIKRTIVGNTYNWMDSHDDVHLDGVFSKSIRDREGKIWHLHDHIHQITAKVGTPDRIYEKDVLWKDLGISKSGVTQALFMDSNIQKDKNSEIFKGYLNGEIDQHSVGMVYVKIDLAMDDDDEKDEYANWQKYLPIIGNAEKALEQGYFFVVKEAKLIEISAVLEGSNELTPTVSNISQSSSKSSESLKSNESIDYKYLINNFKLN